MKTFIKKNMLFLLLIVIFIESVCSILEFTNLYLINYPGKEIYNAIKKSKKKSNSKTLLLGDSVGYSLFPNETTNNGINSLACNQAIGIVGQFLLLNNYLNAGNKIDRVIMLFTPFSFKNNLAEIYTFHYFLKPFNNSEYTPLFTTSVKEQIKKIPYNQFVQIPHIFVTSWAPEFNPPDRNDYTFLSPISIEYLKKIKELSIQYDFELNILPTPTSTEKKKLIKKIDINEISNYNFEHEFEDYFKKIIYVDSTKFMDGTHLIHPEIYVKMYRSELTK